MKKIPLEKLDLNVIYKKLDSGLEIFIVKKENFNNIDVKLSTKFGANILEYNVDGKDIKLPSGVAHYLEHQMFNMKDGSDPLAYFEKYGANANAFTSSKQTSYVFNGVDNFLGCFKYLLDYVSTPYFTDESVKKENGIIVSESKMYQNYPETIIEQKIMENIFHELPYKYPVIGTIDDIKKTTKEDLYNAYNTFYHPSNMFLIVVGNVDENEVIDLVKNHEINQNFKNTKKPNIKLKKYKEKKDVVKKYEEVELDLNVCKTVINYKIPCKWKTEEELQKINMYLLIYLDVKLSRTSDLYNELVEKNLLTDTIDFYLVIHDDFFLLNVYVASNNYEELIKLITKEIESLKFTFSDFDRKRKCSLVSYISASDNINRITSLISGQIINYNKVISNTFTMLKSLTEEEMKDYFKDVSLKYRSIIVGTKKNKDEK